MAGKKGRGGRPRKTAEQHMVQGTYRSDRHGPLPDGVSPLRAIPRQPAAPATLGAPLAFLDADDCPDVLTPEGKAFWLTLIVTRPTERIYAQLFCTYVEARDQWQRSTTKIHLLGDLLRAGQRAVPNPHYAIQREATRTMNECAQYLGWDPATVKADQRPAVPTRLEVFLASRARIVRRRPR